MGARTGEQYLNSLRKTPPEVWLGNSRIVDIPGHPLIGPAAQELARLYDIQHDPKHRSTMLYVPPGEEEHVSTQFLVPRSIEDLQRRGLMHKAWADATYGLMGRSTDFLGAVLTSWYISADFFGDYADNVRSYYKYVRDNDLFLTHTLVDPPVDRSKGPAQQADPTIPLRVVRETGEGLVVSGAKAVATAAPYAEEILVWPFEPRGLTAEDKSYAIGFAIPASSQGLRFICRDPYGGGNRFDHPLASRFDEMDAVAIFEDVLVPWERVFVNQDPELISTIMRGYLSTYLTALSPHQTAIRLLSKLQFIAGLVKRGMEMVRREPVFVQDRVAEITSYIELLRACITAAETDPFLYKDGVMFPNLRHLSVTRVVAPWWYPKAREVLQLALSTNLVYRPADASIFDSPVAADVDRYFRGAEASAEDRLKLFNAAADLALASFGGRHELYERFYSGDPFMLRIGIQYQRYDWSECLALVDSFLSSFDRSSGS